VVELMADHLRQHACSVAFPELAHLPLHALRKFCRASRVERFRK
jgi:nucleolar complex protein 2